MAVVGKYGVTHPKTAELQYTRDLSNYARSVFRKLSQDVDAGTQQEILAMLVLYESFYGRIDDANIRSIRAAHRKNSGSASAFRIERSESIDTGFIKTRSQIQNFNLIRSIDAKQRIAIRRELNAIGDDLPPLSRRLTPILDGQVKRARLIARDQSLTINGNLAATRHQAAGASSYTWRDSDDRRVRPDHAAVDGVVYEYGEETGTNSGNAPGEDVLCRCIAEPVFL